MIQFKPVRDKLREWMKRESPIPIEVIFADLNTMRPAPPYGELKFPTNEARVGGLDEVRQNTPGNFTLAKMREVRASINFYGQDAVYNLGRILDSLDRPDVIDEFSVVGFSHIGTSEVRDLSQLEETVFRGRAQVDLDLYVTSEDAVTLSTFQEVDVSDPRNPNPLQIK